MTADTLNDPLTTCGKHRRRRSCTGAGQHRLMPSDVPARSQARPGWVAAVPMMDMMKSGPPAITGRPAGMPSVSSASVPTVPTRSPTSTKGGNFSWSMCRWGIALSFQKKSRNIGVGTILTALPVRNQETYSAQGRNHLVRS